MIGRQTNIICALAVLLLVSSCAYFKKKGTAATGAIARVNDEYLYGTDIPNITKGLTSEDSLNALKSYAESWAKKKLLLQKAKENIPDDDIGITKKIEDYRETLLLYEYEKALIEQKLDTTVRELELSLLYEKMKDNFKLDNDVYLVYFVKLKKDATGADDARKWILKPKDEDDLRKLEGYCKEYATTYSLQEGLWYSSENFLKNFPLSNYELGQLTASRKFMEFKREESNWYLRIADLKKAGDPSPLELVRDNLAKIVVEKRKMVLIDKTYERIFSDGVKSKSYDIYLK